MKLKSLTYTSFARLDLTADDVGAIHRTAMQLNALEGITGLLIFNGTHFLQVIEGAEEAIDELLHRLRGDRRHDGIEVRDERFIDQRSFPDWAMELVHVKAGYFDAQDQVLARLPDDLSAEVRSQIHKMSALISGTVELPD